MSETCPASGASNPILRFAKSDDGTSFQGRNASRERHRSTWWLRLPGD